MKQQTAKETDYLNAFSEQVRKLLKENKLTQRQLAKAIGVTPNAVNEWINEKSQPKWLLQMFGTIKFFYENVKDFNPMDLFFIEDMDVSKNGYNPLKSPIEKKMEQIEQDCNDRIERIKNQAQNEIQRIKDKYEGNKIDELLEQNSSLQWQIKELQNQVNNLLIKPKNGRQNYEQFREKQIKKYDKLKKEFEDYKSTHSWFSLTGLSEEEFEKLSKETFTLRYSYGDGKQRLRKFLNNPKFYKLIKKTYGKCLVAAASNTPQITESFFEEVGKELVDLVMFVTPYNPLFRND